MALIHINKQNFYHNLNQIALQIGSHKSESQKISLKKIAIVLKDNAYGHGLELMAILASEHGIKHAVVRTKKEAVRIGSLFTTILILGDTITKEDTFSFSINSLEDIKKAQKGAKVELKVDTGMHRNGIAMDEIDEALTAIKEHGLELVGLMTHYRAADTLSSEFFWQQKQFDKVKIQVKNAGFTSLRIHSHNSASILRTKSFNEDLVRVGMAVYGYSPLPMPFDTIELHPVLSLYAKKISTRLLKIGQRVGYGGDYIAKKEMTVSTYSLGYGDGWCRGNVAQPYVTTEGLSMIGRVSMDFISLASQKEEVCIMNNAGNAAKQLGTIPYEITTALHHEIERHIV